MRVLIDRLRAYWAAPATKEFQENSATLRAELGLQREMLATLSAHLGVAGGGSGIGDATTLRHIAALTSAGLTARAARLARRDMPPLPIPVDIPFEQALTKLQTLNPQLFPIWFQLFENGSKSYLEERLGSCSHREHRYAQLFGAYLEIYGHGTILDIGCGPYGMPSYLATRDPRHVFGVEPLPMAVEPHFAVSRGFNEFLPWADAQFDTVVSGTSLDHVLSLKQSLNEVRRVLRPGGRYLVWLASIPGSAPFDETAEHAKAIDQFHLFHFDRTWIEPIFEQGFNIADVTIIAQLGFDHVFYCLEPRCSKAQARSPA